MKQNSFFSNVYSYNHSTLAARTHYAAGVITETFTQRTGNVMMSAWRHNSNDVMHCESLWCAQTNRKSDYITSASSLRSLWRR